MTAHKPLARINVRSRENAMRVEALDARQQAILDAVVRTYITTGEPVASATVARRTGRRLSSATIRNEMAALEEAGYLHQPHTSAGRIPTPKAYEFYTQEVAATARLRPTEQDWIDRQLPLEGAGAAELLPRAPHVLAELCHGIGLVLVPPLPRTVLEQVRFIPLDAQRVLAVLVTRAGLVRDKAIRTREVLAADELARMTDYINQHFRGWTLEAARREIDRRAKAERSEFLRRALSLCEESFEPTEDTARLHCEGVAHLLDRGSDARPEELRQLLEAVEEKERLARFLADCIESPEELRIWIGLEQFSPAMKGFALVSARYGAGQPGSGLLGLLSRTRMDYARAIPAVSYVAALFDRALAEN